MKLIYLPTKEITLTNEGELLIFTGNKLQKHDSETEKLQQWFEESCEVEE